MLCAKKLKAVKMALIPILGVLGATSAHAVLDLTSQPDLMGHDVLVYAAETITTDGKSFTTPLATTEGDPLNVNAVTGVTLPSGTYYLRYDLIAPEGAMITWNGTPIDAWHDDASYTAHRDSYVVFSTTAGVGAAEDLTLSLGGDDDDNDGYAMARVKVRGAAGGGDYKFEMRFRVYDSLVNAVSPNGEGAVFVDAQKPIIAVDNTLSAKVTAMPALTADVAAGFLKFTGGATSGTLSTMDIAVKDMHDPDGAGAHLGWPIYAADTGMPVGIGDVMLSGSVSVSGDFSVGTFKVGTGGATLMDAAGKALEKEGTPPAYVNPGSAATAAFTLANAVGPQALTIDVGAKNEMMIPTGTYSATISLKAIGDSMPMDAVATDEIMAMGTAPGIADVTGAAGEIKRNGTTVHLGYLTTYEGHNQRLVMVNRGGLDAVYSLSNIVTESGTTATPGHMASGTVAAGEAMVIQVRDLVSFADGGTTRAAATLSLTADKSDVSVALTTINLMDRGTDTVTYASE